MDVDTLELRRRQPIGDGSAVSAAAVGRVRAEVVAETYMRTATILLVASGAGPAILTDATGSAADLSAGSAPLVAAWERVLAAIRRITVSRLSSALMMCVKRMELRHRSYYTSNDRLHLRFLRGVLHRVALRPKHVDHHHARHTDVGF